MRFPMVNLVVIVLVISIATSVLIAVFTPKVAEDNMNKYYTGGHVFGKIVIKVYDQYGNIKYDIVLPMHSLTENGVKFFAMVLGQKSATLVDTGGTSRSVKVDTTNINDQFFVGSSYSIGIGYDPNAVFSRDAYIISGEITRYASTVSYGIDNAKIAIVSSFVADRNITFNTVGLYIRAVYANGDATRDYATFLLAYDVLDSSLEITENETVSIAYIFDFP